MASWTRHHQSPKRHMMDYLARKRLHPNKWRRSVSDAAARLHGTEPIADVGVSEDDTWHRKGFSPKLRVVRAISIDNGKVFDVAIIFKSCKGSTSMKKLPHLIPLVMRHESYLIIVILIMPALPLEWKQQELLRSLVDPKRSMDYITLLFMEMVTASHILLSKIYMIQVDHKPIKKFESWLLSKTCQFEAS